jgi:hypothetical protein
MTSKNLWRASCFVLLSAFMSACGGGGGDDGGGPNPPPPPPPDTTAPTVTISEPANGAELSGTATIAGTSSEAATIVVDIISGSNRTELNRQSNATSFSVAWDVTEITEGAYTIEVSATDGSNNTGRASVSVTVENDADNDGVPDVRDACSNEPANTADGCPVNEKPVITLIGDSTIDLEVGDPAYVDAGATATDAEDGDLTANIVIGGDTVDTGTAGTYVITYNVTDSDGAAADEVTRTVTVTGPLPASIGWVGTEGNRVFRNAPTFTEEITIRACASGEFATIQAGGFVARMTGTSGSRFSSEMSDTGESCNGVQNGTIYSTTFVPNVEMPANTDLLGGIANDWFISIRMLDAEGRIIVSDNPIVTTIEMAMLDAGATDVTITQVADNVFEAPGIVNLVFEPNDFDLPLGEFLQLIMTTYFAHYEDVNFPIVQFHNRSIDKNNPFYAFVQNNVLGLCLGTDNITTSYGSDGVLQGIPTTKLMGRGTNHEIGHRWGVYCNEPTGTQDVPVPIHFDVVSFCDPMSNGQGCLTPQNGNLLWNTPESGLFNQDFSELMSYLNGGNTADQVSPWRVIDRQVRNSYGPGDEIPLSDTIEYTIEDYITANSEVRNEDGSSRQQEFTVARIIVSESTPVPVTDMTFLSLQSAHIISSNPGVGFISTGLFGQTDVKGLNAAFSPLRFVENTNRLAQTSKQAVQKAALLRSSTDPATTNWVTGRIINEPWPTFDPQRSIFTLQPNRPHTHGHSFLTEFVSEHTFEEILLRDLSPDSATK